MSKPKKFLAETNNSGRTTEKNRALLQRKGYDVSRLPHQPTALIVSDPLERSWAETRRELARLAKSSRASVVVMSGQTGNVFQLDRGSNRPNTWVKQ